VWVADGVVSERWAPLSPVTGKLDAFEWRAPTERLGQLIDNQASAPEISLAIPTSSTDAPEGEREPAKEDRLDLPAEAVEKAKGRPAKGLSGQAANAGPIVVDSPNDVSEEAADAADHPLRLPDDPGVEPDEEVAAAPGRFKLF
jgi:HemY protein